MISPDKYLTHSLIVHPQGAAVSRILAAAVNAVEPAEAVCRFVNRRGAELVIRQGSGNLPQEEVIPLEQVRNIVIIGIGKAAIAMTRPLVEMLEDKQPKGLLVVKYPEADVPANFEQVIGNHPVPGSGSLMAGQLLKSLTAGLSQDDLLICLISGGGSALVTAPLPGVSLRDMQALTSSLLSCGARIDEINTLRRHLDEVKGGGLARLATPARVVSLILSDVVGSPLEAIASGPTAPDPSTSADALAILDKYNLRAETPAGILSILESPRETPKPGDALFQRVQNILVGDNCLAAQAGLKQAGLEGYDTFLCGNDLQGEAREAALVLVELLQDALKKKESINRPFCMVFGGETTVTLLGSGKGGRNQELALAAVNQLEGLPGSLLVTLGTDGEDGPTDAAGAVVTPESASRGLAAGMRARDFLANNDAYGYFSQISDLVKPGPTGTNVNDLNFLFGF
jgi:glycerate 2-kinase